VVCCTNPWTRAEVSSTLLRWGVLTWGSPQPTCQAYSWWRWIGRESCSYPWPRDVWPTPLGSLCMRVTLSRLEAQMIVMTVSWKPLMQFWIGIARGDPKWLAIAPSNRINNGWHPKGWAARCLEHPCSQQRLQKCWRNEALRSEKDEKDVFHKMWIAIHAVFDWQTHIS